MKRRTFIFIILLLLFGTSCSSNKILFNNIPFDLRIEIPEPTIIKGDILDINISSLNNQSSSIFSSTTQLEKIGTLRNSEARKLDGYIVASSGKIDIPTLGKVNAVGETTTSLADSLKKQLSEFVKKPNVRIKILNFRVSILGEVNNPQTINVIDQYISLPELISKAGGLKNTADRKNVLIIREFNGKIKSKILDLTSSEFFESEFYFLKQNDKVYIKPDKTSLALDFGVVRNAGILSLITSILIIFLK